MKLGTLAILAAALGVVAWKLGIGQAVMSAPPPPSSSPPPRKGPIEQAAEPYGLGPAGAEADRTVNFVGTALGGWLGGGSGRSMSEGFKAIVEGQKNAKRGEQ